MFKKKPLKKIAATNLIFENVQMENARSDEDDSSLRISIDTKAKVNIGEFSRGGKTRALEPPAACDHDIGPQEKLVPFGILNLSNDQTDIIFGRSNETSDFIVDGLELWWDKNASENEGIKELVINLDNGPQIASNRTQFIRRMVEFANRISMAIHLIYYPPYHSKYNAIERCWSNLERHWNGEILNSAKKALKWASTMTWKGVQTSVSMLEQVYEKGISLTKQEMEKYEAQLLRSETLPKWDVRITPTNLGCY